MFRLTERIEVPKRTLFGRWASLKADLEAGAANDDAERLTLTIEIKTRLSSKPRNNLPLYELFLHEHALQKAEQMDSVLHIPFWIVTQCKCNAELVLCCKMMKTDYKQQNVEQILSMNWRLMNVGKLDNTDKLTALSNCEVTE